MKRQISLPHVSKFAKAYLESAAAEQEIFYSKKYPIHYKVRKLLDTDGIPSDLVITKRTQMVPISLLSLGEEAPKFSYVYLRGPSIKRLVYVSKDQGCVETDSMEKWEFPSHIHGRKELNMAY
jgi:hypothetical protein